MIPLHRNTLSHSTYNTSDQAMAPPASLEHPSQPLNCMWFMPGKYCPCIICGYNQGSHWSQLPRYPSMLQELAPSMTITPLGTSMDVWPNVTLDSLSLAARKPKPTPLTKEKRDAVCTFVNSHPEMTRKQVGCKSIVF